MWNSIRILESLFNSNLYVCSLGDLSYSPISAFDRVRLHQIISGGSVELTMRHPVYCLHQFHTHLKYSLWDQFSRPLYHFLHHSHFILLYFIPMIVPLSHLSHIKIIFSSLAPMADQAIGNWHAWFVPRMSRRPKICKMNLRITVPIQTCIIWFTVHHSQSTHKFL